MITNTRGTGVESRLLDLLEYRVILGAVITTPDGLLVASSAVDIGDAELLAATTAAREERESRDPEYWAATSEFGAIRVVNGEDMRLIVLTDPDIPEEQIRPLMVEHLRDIEEMIRI
ncbi:MAG TPA: hypothetical protein VKZ96_12150 [Thermomicrobiales bacterium]|nr:hypothetical protein [Thermomicrobiales bacterium]